MEIVVFVAGSMAAGVLIGFGIAWFINNMM